MRRDSINTPVDQKRKFLAPGLLIWVTAAVGASYVDGFQLLQLLFCFYFVFACFCLWKCSKNLPSKYQTLAKAGVMLMGLCLAVAPLVGVFAMQKMEERLEAEFEYIDGEDVQLKELPTVTPEQARRLIDKNRENNKRFEDVRKEMGLDSMQDPAGSKDEN